MDASDFPPGPQTVLPASLGEVWGADYGQAGGHGVEPAVLLWLPPCRLWAGFLAAVSSSERGYPITGQILIAVADNCRQAVMVASWILQHRTSSCPQV